MTAFTPVTSLFGGALIGLSAVLLMAFHGRIAGMTGILSGLLPPVSSDWAWRAAFVAGAIVAPMLILNVSGDAIAYKVNWKGGSLKALEGKPVTLHLQLEKADLYSLQFTP